MPLIPVGVLLGQIAVNWDYTSAETATVLCYASTFASGGGLALQPDAVVSSGFAGLLWVLLLAVPAAVGLPLLASAKALGAALAAAALYLLPGVPRALRGERSLRASSLLPPLLLAIHPALGLHAAGGLETSLNLLLITVALRLFVREEEAFERRGQGAPCLGSALPLLLLLLTRPEAPVLVGALMTARLLARAAARQLPWRTLAWLLLPPAAYGLYLLWSYLTFADPWPGVFTAREALPQTRFASDQALAAGWASLQQLYRQWGLTAPLLAVALLGALRVTVTYWGRVGILGVGVGAVAAVALVGGDVELGRRALPAGLVLALLAAEGIDLIADRLRALWGPGLLWRLTSAALALGLLAAPAAAGWRSLASPRPSPFLDDQGLVETISREVQSVGWIPEQVRVMTAAPGALALRGFRVVDVSGVTDPAIRRYAGNRRPLELQHLIFRERRPHVLLERRPWRGVHGLSRYPEARRGFVKVSPGPRLRADISLSRSLLLEPAPWTAGQRRQQVAQHLWLVGARAMSGHLMLLWTTDRNHPPGAARLIEVGLGQAWKTRVGVGPHAYPMHRWRAGEVVRQAIPVPRGRAPGEHPLWLRVGARRITVARRMDGGRLDQDRWSWYARHLDGLVSRGAWDRAEVLVMLWQDPSLNAALLMERITARVQRLMKLGLVTHAARQLALARACHSLSPQLRRLAATLATRCYEQAEEHMRFSRWPPAVTALKAAALADPRSPWIRRRLEEAQKRLPAGKHLIRLLELEVAQRALVLAPDAERLARVMRAHLALEQAQEAVVAYNLWTRDGRLAASDRCRFLLAKALAHIGRLPRALQLLEDQLSRSPPQPQPRRCPSWNPLQPLALQAQLLRLLQKPVMGSGRPVALEGPLVHLGPGTWLVAHCARWSPAEPVEVVLYLRQASRRDLPLEIAVGNRRRRMVITGNLSGREARRAEAEGSGLRREQLPLRRIVVRLQAPPATYPVRLHLGGGAEPVELGTVTVGPEANFGFELPSYTSWHVQGTAFGAAPVAGRSARWHYLFGYVGERYADSYATDRDRPIGSLTSPRFKLRKDFLMLLVAGGDQPALGVHLKVDGRRVHSVRGGRSMILRPVILPVGRFRGRWARLIVRDGGTGHWGYIAVDEIRQLDGPAPGVAP